VYTPNADTNGMDQVVVQVTNPWGKTGLSTIDFTIDPVNDAPVIAPNEPFVLFGMPALRGQLAARDVDGDVLAYAVEQGPAHGSFAIDALGCWVYTPAAGYCGDDGVLVGIDDGNGGTAQSALHFTVNVYQGGDVVVEGFTETLRLDNVSKADLGLTRLADDLCIAIAGRGSLTLAGYFSAPGNGVDRLETVEGPLYLGKDRIVQMDQGCRPWWLPGWAEGMAGVRNLITGTAASDIIQGKGESDVLFGVGGGDILNGRAGNDTLIGGPGGDVLDGKQGHDSLFGDEGADLLIGGQGDDALIGGKGDDLLDGGQGDDWLFGGEGDDSLAGKSGNDLLRGGPGDDDLSGGDGDDVYVFYAGDGRDRIRDKDGGSGGFDTVRFGPGIAKEDVAILLRSNNLYLQYGETDVVEIFHQSKEKDKVERIELADGSYLTDADVNRVIAQIAAYAAGEGIHLKSVDDVRRNDELMVLVAAGWQLPA